MIITVQFEQFHSQLNNLCPNHLETSSILQYAEKATRATIKSTVLKHISCRAGG
jgi:hypothetical protein